MKRTLTTIALTAFSTAAIAGGNIDLRGNYTSSTVDNSGTKTTTAGLTADRARVNFNGKISDTVSGKAQLYFDATTPGLKFAEMSHKLGDSMTLSLGKIDDAGYGGFEGMKTAADQYFTSLNYKHGYILGANLGYKISDSQNLLFHVMNEGENAGATGTSNGYGARWLGQFDSSTVVVSYHTVPLTPATSSASTNTSPVITTTTSAVPAANYMTIGYQYKADALTASLDYITKTTKTDSTGASAADGNSKSIVAMVDYNMGTFVPNFKFESSTNTAVNATTESKQTQYSLGTHIIPNEGEAFRYQIEYVGKSTNTGVSGAADVNTTTLYAGVRMVADFLK